MKLIPSPFVFALAFSFPCLAYFGPARGQKPDGNPAGSFVVDLNIKDSRPCATIENKTGKKANDLHFRLVPSLPNLKLDKITITDPDDKDMGWGKPVRTGPGEYSMVMKPAGAGGKKIPLGRGANLDLLSINPKKGWRKVIISLTQNGRTLYPPKAMADQPVTLLTGNRFPVGLSALTKIENVGSLAITRLQLSLDTTQRFVEIGSERPGFGVPADGFFVFEKPLLPGEKVSFFWKYDGFASDPLHDTQVTITPVTEAMVLSLRPSEVFIQEPDVGGVRRKVSNQLKSWKVKDPTIVLPAMKLLVLDGKQKRAVLTHRGRYTFQIQGVSVRLLKGSAKLGKPYLNGWGNLVVPFSGTTKTFELEISGLVARFGPKAEKGLVKIYLRGKKADQRLRLGYRR
jgi:hypothetical protein